MTQKTSLTETELYEKAQRLVRNEVFCCVTAEVEAMLKAEILQYDDIENLYVDPALYKEYGYESAAEFADSGENYREIFEWWAVSDWLADKLREKGQPILEGPGCLTYWGRTTTGQAIYMDYVIRQIVEEL